MRKPNFFIIGAPKCGTTALSEYLRSHPQLFFSSPKEPHFFSADIASRHRVTTLGEYQSLFSAAEDRHLIVAEGSVHYLQSKVALNAIDQYSPGSKFVALLRNPVDLAYSWHAEAQYSEYETEKSFSKVWRERMEEGRVYAGKGDPKLMDYVAVASIGTQLRHAISVVGRDRIKIIFHEDLLAKPRSVYIEVLEFIGLGDDGRRDFARVNDSKAVRSHSLMGLSHLVATTKARLGIRGGLGILEAINVRRSRRPELDPELRSRMVERFRAEILDVERITGRSLVHWLR